MSIDYNAQIKFNSIENKIILSLTVAYLQRIHHKQYSNLCKNK